jgi:predicted CXXCH cytochrome family protein
MQTFAARVVAEKRECATCHVAWMADFKRDDVVTLIPNNPRPLEKTGRQDVVSTERMCFSCHDGFVRDSRFLWQGGHTHPVGVKPSDKVHIPTEDGKTIFPLNDAGNIYCGTCHSAHGVEWGDKLSPVFLRKQNIDSSLCIMCHTDRKGETNGLQNHPLLKDAPKGAKTLLKAGSKLGQKDQIICQSCHRIHGAEEKKLLVKKNGSSQLCSTCHTDKTADRTATGEEHFTHPVNKIPESASVPKQFDTAGSKFGPKKEVICETCHKVHHSSSDKLIVLDQEHLREGICVNCHEDKRGILDNGHNMFKTREKEIADATISPILGTCGNCHNIHGGNGPKMWARNLDSPGDRTAGLCLSCHKKGHLAEEFTIGQFSHPVGAKLPQGAESPLQLPLFTTTGTRTSSRANGRVSCPTCHDIHSPSSSTETTSFFGDTSESKGKYLRIGEQDRLTLCKRCHQDKWSVTDTKHDLDKEMNNLGICGNCHLVHNGKGPRMWARDDAAEQADPTSLCLSCHRKDGLAKDKTPGEHSHPVGISVENADVVVTEEGWTGNQGTGGKPLPSTLPLYDKDGRRQQDSKLVGCGTCHDPHRWDANHTGSSVPSKEVEGDARNSFLRIAAAPDGQLCTTCHRSKEPVRGTDHDMAVTAPDTSNILDEDPGKSGVCGQCHAVHNANQDLVLWARLPGPGRDAAEMLCRSCHSDGEVAQIKAPEKAHHPNYVRAWSSELRKSIDPNLQSIPMFSNDGRRSEIGYISCPTCHNAHQWRARKPIEGSGKNEEGDVLSSFLRLPSTEGFICADCHGLDSIFRYKYFHGVGREAPR